MADVTKKKGGRRTIPVSLKGGSGGLLYDVSAYSILTVKEAREI